MINKAERISMSHIADIVSGEQRHISDYVELDREEVYSASRRVLLALRKRNKVGGEKI